jgi:hypothetical protein
VIEPFYEKIHDFSVQYEWTESGELKMGEPRIFFTDPNRFSYKGSCLGLKGLPEEAAFNQIVAVESEWRPAHLRVAEILREKGFHGNFGIDCLWAKRGEDERQVIPVIEVNVRTTMGRVAVEIERSLRRHFGRADGYWWLATEADLTRSGVSGFTGLEKKLKERFGDRLVPTTPASQAKSTWSYALLGSERP